MSKLINKSDLVEVIITPHKATLEAYADATDTWANDCLRNFQGGLYCSDYERTNGSIAVLTTRENLDSIDIDILDGFGRVIIHYDYEFLADRSDDGKEFMTYGDSNYTVKLVDRGKDQLEWIE